MNARTFQFTKFHHSKLFGWSTGITVRMLVKVPYLIISKFNCGKCYNKDIDKHILYSKCEFLNFEPIAFLII